MFERFTYTPEIIRNKRSIHEVGGFDAETWRPLVDGTIIPHSDVTPRFIRYGKAVVEGEIEDHSFAHRDYLSRTDWRKLSYAMHAPIIEDRKTIRRHPKIEIPIMKNVKLYADFEAERAYTIHDYRKEGLLLLKPRPLSKYNSAITWSDKHHRWMVNYTPHHWNNSVVEPSLQELSIADKNRLRAAFLLDTPVTEDILGSRPEVLWEDVFTRAMENPQDIANSLRQTMHPWKKMHVPMPGLRKPASKFVAEQLQMDYAAHFDGVKPYIDWQLGYFSFRPANDFERDRGILPQIDGEYEYAKDLPKRFRPLTLATI